MSINELFQTRVTSRGLFSGVAPSCFGTAAVWPILKCSVNPRHAAPPYDKCGASLRGRSNASVFAPTINLQDALPSTKWTVSCQPERILAMAAASVRLRAPNTQKYTPGCVNFRGALCNPGRASNFFVRHSTRKQSKTSRCRGVNVAGNASARSSRGLK